MGGESKASNYMKWCLTPDMKEYKSVICEWNAIDFNAEKHDKKVFWIDSGSLEYSQGKHYDITGISKNV